MLKKQLNYFWFFLLASLWSGSFVAIKEVLKTVPPFFGAALRVGLALFFIKIILCFLKKDVSVTFSMRRQIWIMGLFSQGFPFFFLFWGEQYISPGLASIINGTVPIWTLLLGLHSAKTRDLSYFNVISLGLGILGICIIFWPALYLNETRTYLLGTLSVGLMAICYAIGNLLNQNRLSGKIKLDFYTNIYHQLWASFTFLMLASFSFESLSHTAHLFHNPGMWVASIYMGLFSTALAWIIYYHLIQEWGAIRASTVLYIVPIMAIGWEFVFFHNYPRFSEALGTLIILVSVVLIQSKRQKRQSTIDIKP